jgi:hypothetical protein
MSEQGGSSPLLLLLKATSKQAIDDFLCACNVERELLKGPGAARIADLAASFGITEAEAKEAAAGGRKPRHRGRVPKGGGCGENRHSLR